MAKKKVHKKTLVTKSVKVTKINKMPKFELPKLHPRTSLYIAGALLTAIIALISIAIIKAPDVPVSEYKDISGSEIKLVQPSPTVSTAPAIELIEPQEGDLINPLN